MAALARDVIVDKYRILERIGSGAMGEVYLALDETLGRKVALKILSDVHRNNPELRARFSREARAVAAISHPNVVQVFTTGEYDGRPYLAMEYLRGRDLGTIVKQDGPLDGRVAAAVVRDAAKGLAAAAKAGLIHRDVKPSNLMMLDDGVVKVTDFGLAKPVESGADPALTAMGVVVGTPDYIAPEQARGDEIDWRVDIYALGCTLFFVLAGRPPYRKSVDDEEKYLKVVARHLRDPVPDPRDERADVDDDLATLQLAMMAKNPEDRPDYAAVVARLDRINARLVAAAASAPRARPAGRGEDDEDDGGVVTRKMDTPQRLVRQSAAEASTEAAGGPAPAASSPSGGDASFVPAPARVSRPLVAVTVLSAAIFVIGLALLLFGPRPTPAASVVKSADAGPPAGAPDAGAPVVPQPPPAPPAGMLAVNAPDGQPRLFVDRAPVTHRAYGEFMRSHRYAKRDADRPVVGVSYDYAVAYARFRGKRLLRADEWQPALDTPNFVPAGMKLWEWVDDGDAAARDRAVRRVNGGSGRRKPAGSATITFRLAQDVDVAR